MSYEIYECIDAGSDYCPCHLAETGDCIICSQLRNSGICQCKNWCGTCIYQDFLWNQSKSKNSRQYHRGKILQKDELFDDLIILTIKLSHILVKELKYAGSYVFFRKKADEPFFDFPISIMDYDDLNSTIKVAIQLAGVKTNRINDLNEGEEILVKGPYWNGILGIKHIKNCKGKTAVLIARGIGQAPLIPTIKTLKTNGNEVILVVDKGRYNELFIKEYIDELCDKVIELPLFEKGDIPSMSKEILIDLLLDYKPEVVHCDGVDILNYSVMKLVESINEALGEELLKYSCCNNARMCCGEGVCGGCTFKTNDRVLRRMCKMQTEPKYVLEGRRIL